MPIDDRSDDEIIWALQTWLGCTLLDPFELELLETLRNAIVLRGREEFLAQGRMLMMLFAPHLHSAADKARAQGIGAWINAEQPVV
jgi:hypothetical protein